MNLIECVDNEHVDEVLPGAVQPVVEGGRPLGELQVEAVHPLKNLESQAYK